MDRCIDIGKGGALATPTINDSGNPVSFGFNIDRCFSEQHFVSLPPCNDLLELRSCTL